MRIRIQSSFSTTFPPPIKGFQSLSPTTHRVTQRPPATLRNLMFLALIPNIINNIWSNARPMYPIE